MKYTWEPGDIKGGRKVTIKNTKEIWVIGYVYVQGEKENRYVLVSLNDGLVTKAHTKQELCNIFNSNNYEPVEFLDTK